MIDDVIKNEVDRISGDDNVRRSLGKVEGLVKDYKKSPFRKFADIFFAEDLPTVRKSLVSEVIIPTAKDFFVNTMIEGLYRTFYGRGGSGKYPPSPQSSLTRYHSQPTPYSGMSKPKAISENSTAGPSEKRFTFEDVVMRDRSSAQALLDILRSEIRESGSVSVSQLYDALDVTDNLSFTDNYWGWTNLDTAKISRVRDGYWLDLPKPISLE